MRGLTILNIPADNFQENDFGYDEGKPCVAIKMNRIFEFVPQIANGDDIVIKCEGKSGEGKGRALIGQCQGRKMRG